ncbi:Zinc metalloprotease Rip1 [Paraconexibacter sp. AEG42_29]|uniref:Zinc metalloprotease Rip1 n=1 Tax=Paraconexibacter sp. AEG42_29 TaxID=2997339 RepID=A0AAU7AV55_9ACTN
MSYFLAFAGFAVLIVLHELGHFAAAKAVGMRVERFALFFPPLIAKVKRGETEYGIGCIPLGGYVRITGMNPSEEIPPDVAHRAYYRQAPWKRIVVIAAGPLVNIIVAFLILWALFVFKGVQEISPNVDRVNTGSPAAGKLIAGDRVVSVDGRTGGAEQFSNAVKTHRCEGRATNGCKATTPARIVVDRDGAQKAFSITPVYDAQTERTRLGFTFGIQSNKEGILEASSSSVSGMWRVSKATVSSIGRIFTSSEARKEVSGVVGSYEVTRQTISTFGFVDALNILAIISLSLAIVNLFPFLPLDGGHIFWALAEKLRGRAIPFDWMEKASVVGFMLVIALFAIGLTNDIGRLRGEGFGVR